MIRVTLPPVFDDDGSSFLIKPFDLPLYPAQAEHEFFEGKRELAAMAFEISERGFVFVFPRGRFTHRPHRFDEAVAAAGLRLPIVGFQASAGLHAIDLAFKRLSRRRGARGKGKAKAEMNDTLLAEFLMRLSSGASWRAAARATLDANSRHFAGLPDESALIKLVQRALSNSAI